MAHSKKDQPTLIYGRHPVMDALKEGTPIEKIWLQTTIRGEFEKELRSLCREKRVPLSVTPKERLNRIVRGNHQGVIGQISLIPYYRLEDVMPHIYEKGATPLLLILDSITDVRNFGAIARSAEVLGAHAMLVPSKGSALINSEALKTSAGALTKIPVCREHSLNKSVDFLKDSGIQIVASALEEAVEMYEVDFTLPTAIIMGEEGEGVSRSLLNKADKIAMIPQLGTTDSLNVSVATGVLLAEVVRQRRSIGS